MTFRAPGTSQRKSRGTTDRACIPSPPPNTHFGGPDLTANRTQWEREQDRPGLCALWPGMWGHDRTGGALPPWVQ